MKRNRKEVETYRFNGYPNGITRSTRIARLAPGVAIRVEVVGKLRRAYAGEPRVGDLPP